MIDFLIRFNDNGKVSVAQLRAGLVVSSSDTDSNFKPVVMDPEDRFTLHVDTPQPDGSVLRRGLRVTLLDEDLPVPEFDTVEEAEAWMERRA